MLLHANSKNKNKKEETCSKYKDNKYNDNNNKKDKNDNKYNDNNKRNNNNNNKRRIKNHNQRKKFGYARCQELFHKCPKKLAEYTIKSEFFFYACSSRTPSCRESKRTVR